MSVVLPDFLIAAVRTPYLRYGSECPAGTWTSSEEARLSSDPHFDLSGPRWHRHAKGSFLTTSALRRENMLLLNGRSFAAERERKGRPRGQTTVDLGQGSRVEGGGAYSGARVGVQSAHAELLAGQEVQAARLQRIAGRTGVCKTSKVPTRTGACGAETEGSRLWLLLPLVLRKRRSGARC